MRTIIFNQGVFPGEKLEGRERYKMLYHFTSLETFKLIWDGQNLKYGNLTGVNDILEAEYAISIDNPQQGPLMFAFDDLRKMYKQISFTMDYDTYLKGAMSSLMWGIYGDKRNGICIALDYDKIKFPDNVLKDIVDYKKYIPGAITLDRTLRTTADIQKFIIENQKILMFTKTEEWAGENEYRVLSNTDDFLDIKGAISYIVITKSSLPILDDLITLTNNEIPIRVLQHKLNAFHKVTIPVISDAIEVKTQNENALNNPDNFLNSMRVQAEEHYLRFKDNPDADLTKSEYLCI